MMRVGLVGLGLMGRHHARLLGENREIDFLGAFDPRGDEHDAMRSGILFSTLADLISANLDAAIIAVPTIHHHETALALADAGVPTLIEKPLADSVRTATEIRDAFDLRELLGAVGHVERFNSALQEMKKRLGEGELGHVISISTVRVGPFPHRVQDVGVVKDLATHDIDIAMWLGESDFSHVDGQLAHRMGRPQEDLVVANGRLENGVVVSLNVNWLTPTKQRRVSVLGEKGQFVADMLTGDLVFYANADVDSKWDQLAQLRGVSEGNMVRYAFTKREPLAVEQEAFWSAVAGDASEGVVSLDQGVRILEVAEAIIGSES